MTAEAWAFTEDEANPCPLCVQWTEEPDDFMGEKAQPIWPDGSVVPLVYKFTHHDCLDAAIAYSVEASLEGWTEAEKRLAWGDR